jgi:hypothetical protein
MSATLAVFDGSETARRRFLSRRGEPLFYAEWDNVVFIHYETDPQELQRCIPYHLDFYHGRAFVSLVAFTMRGMRPRFGGRIAELLLRPIATHDFSMFAPTSGTTANPQFISCVNGFRAGWRHGWGRGASDCRIDLEE